MTTYTRPVTSGNPTTGQTIKADHINEPIDFIFDTILAGGITADQLAASAVTAGKIGTDAVITIKIQDNAVTGAKFNSNAVDDSTIELSSDQLQLKDDGITAAKLNSALDTVKAWAVVDSDGTLLASFNTTSSTKNATGKYTVVWDTDFSSANYAPIAQMQRSTSTAMGNAAIITQAVGSVTVETGEQGSGLFDRKFYIAAYGSQ